MKVFIAHVPLITALLITSCGTSPSEPGDTPSPSILTIEFTGGEECQVTATWTICADANFSSYAVYRSSIPNISENVSSSEVLAVYDNPNQRTYVDNDVDWITHYYYAVRTGNSDEEYSWSNEEEILTPSSGGGSGVTIIEGPIQNPTTGNLYYLLSEAPWDESQAFCVSHGGNLVTINDQTENDWLLATFLALLPEYNNFWTGFNDVAVEGEWEWVSDEPVTYTNWAPGQPDDSGGEDYCWLIGVNYPEYKDWNDVPINGLSQWGLPNGILELEGSNLR